MNPSQPTPITESDALTPIAGSTASNRIRYSNNFGDLMAFVRHHYSRSPTIKRQKYMLAFLIFAVGFFVVLVARRDSEWPSRVFYATCSAGLGTIVAVLVFNWQISSQARKMYGEGSLEGMVGEHTLETDGKYLIETTAVNSSRQAISTSMRIEEDGEYVFVYVSALGAHVIPRHSVVQGDVDSFLLALRSGK